MRQGDVTLFRGFGDGLTPILLLTARDGLPASLKRLEHEYALKSELDGAWAARPVELSGHNHRTTLVLEDPGGEPLDRLIGRPLALAEVLRIAIAFARALRRMHDRGLVHKDIKPANVLVDVRSGGVWLTGFGIASRVPRERPDPQAPEVIAGTLAYMAPEQTGRMNRSVDARSDLYSFGRHALRAAHRRTALHGVRSDGMGPLPHRAPAASAERTTEPRCRHSCRRS